ncbi:hypothetical protein B0H12DRAFT_1232612 [Mycena haematopus]|nr:hypothetical protein B0H12DRAFT_1232612 [Mycena haematopus]
MATSEADDPEDIPLNPPPNPSTVAWVGAQASAVRRRTNLLPLVTRAKQRRGITTESKAKLDRYIKADEEECAFLLFESTTLVLERLESLGGDDGYVVTPALRRTIVQNSWSFLCSWRLTAYKKGNNIDVVIRLLREQQIPGLPPSSNMSGVHTLATEVSTAFRNTRSTLKKWFVLPCAAERCGPEVHNIGTITSGIIHGHPHTALTLQLCYRFAHIRFYSKENRGKDEKKFWDDLDNEITKWRTNGELDRRVQFLYAKDKTTYGDPSTHLEFIDPAEIDENQKKINTFAAQVIVSNIGNKRKRVLQDEGEQPSRTASCTIPVPTTVANLSVPETPTAAVPTTIAAVPIYSITNNNCAGAKRAAAQAKAAELKKAEDARMAQREKGWEPGLVEGSVVIHRTRRPALNPDGTVRERVVKGTAAPRLDASEKALLGRAKTGEKRKAASSVAQGPSKSVSLTFQIELQRPFTALLNQHEWLLNASPPPADEPGIGPA